MNNESGACNSEPNVSPEYEQVSDIAYAPLDAAGLVGAGNRNENQIVDDRYNFIMTTINTANMDGTGTHNISN